MTTPPGTPHDTPLDALSLDDLRRRTSVKWRAYPPDVLPLFVAEMDVPLAPVVTETVARVLADGDTGYDIGTGYGEALADHAARRWGWEVDVARTRTVPDVMLGIVAVLEALTGPGDAVVLTPPVYPPFTGFTQNAGRRVVHAPLDAAGRLDPATLERAFADATGSGAHGSGPGSGRRAVLLLCNPHNPTGVAHTRDELAGVLALADRYGVRVVSDEIHAPLAGAGDGSRSPYVPLLTVPGSDAAVALLSASKAFNLAGLKAAVAVAGPEAAADLRRVPEEVGHGVSHVAALAHAAALRGGDAWLDGVLRGVARNRALLDDLLAAHLPGVRHRAGEATYFAWLDVRDVVPAGEEPARFLLREARVALVEGSTFGPGGQGHVRLNLATSPAVLTEAVERLAAAVRGQ